MILRKTLNFYFMKVFLKSILSVFLICFAIIFLVDLIERIRELSDQDGWTFLFGVQMALYRTPTIAEQVLPFAILIGSTVAFLNLTRKLELAVTRASGVSVWQFIRPALFLAIFIGILTSIAYNPLSVWLQEQSEQMEIQQFSNGQNFRKSDTASIWFRQEGSDGESILSADRSRDRGLTLISVTALVFNEDRTFKEQVDAVSANWKDGYWQLNDARVTTADSPPELRAEYRLSTFFTQEQARQQAESTGNLSFWRFSDAIEAAERAGLNTNRMRLEFQTHLARPMLFAAMVIIAATVSLKLTRLGGAGHMVLGGIGAGFVLYVLSELVGDFGSNGLLEPALAAWLPALIASVLGVTVLLYQEDG
ncbi:MAG: LPS export ABC transporter permease LptG [Alphaproteobacteria bacterium]